MAPLDGDRRARGGDLARPGRRHLGGARPAAALRPLEGHGVGRVRPVDRHGRALRPRRAPRPLARDARRDPPAGLRGGLRRAPEHVHAVLRLGGAGREHPAHPARGLPAPGRRSGDGHHRRRPRRPRRRRLRLAVLDGGDRRRPARERGPVPRMLVLARRRARDERAPRRGPRPVRAPRRPGERPRAARRGVRRRPPAPGRQLPAGVQPPRAHQRRARDLRRRAPGEPFEIAFVGAVADRAAIDRLLHTAGVP